MLESNVFLGDCMDFMREKPDKFWDLAICDPPYGIGAGSIDFANGTSNNKKMAFKEMDWDLSIPDISYFKELERVSNNQIIWGANYFASIIPPSSCWVVWDKKTGDNSYADAELAFTSFDGAVRMYSKLWLGSNAKDSDGRYHPTQKPVALYKWLLHNYAKAGDKILDTHLGSGSSRIAAHDMGFDFWGYEIDKDYFEAQEKRFKNHIAQLTLSL